MSCFILSCDGGGIRGLITALLIQRLEQDCELLEKVDLFAGTSTGGILSLALASGVPIEGVVGLYQNDGPTIFTPFEPGEAARFLDVLRHIPHPKTGNADFDSILDDIWDALDGLFFVKYGHAGLQSVLSGILSTQPLNNLPHKVMVTTFQLHGPSGWGPMTINNLIPGQGGDTLPLDAALSTGAAPVYFPPYQHPKYGYCVDGGVFANNPCSLALGLALQAGNALADIKMLSLSTGTARQSMDVSFPAPWYGPLLWLLPFAYKQTPALPLLSVLMDGVPPANTLECQQLLGGNFMRADPPLSSAIPLDGYKDVALLEQAAQAYIESPVWQQVRDFVCQGT